MVFAQGDKELILPREGGDEGEKMKKNKQQLKERQMAMAIEQLGKNPMLGQPTQEDWAEAGKLLCMAYEDYPRFVSFGLVCWRDYQKARIERQLIQTKKTIEPYIRAAEFMEMDRKILEKIKENPVLKKQLEKSFEEWKEGLKTKKEG